MADHKQDGWLTAPLAAGEPAEIDTSVAHPARVYDYWGPYEIVARLMGALPSGSYLAISHPASDIHPGQAEAQRRYNERVSTPQTLRTRAEVSRFFDGLDPVPPGLVYVHTWRPGRNDIVPPDGVSAYGGVARKP